MSLPARLLGANPSIQVSSLLSGTLTTPSAKGSFTYTTFDSIASATPTGTSELTFSSIPSDYKHLQIRANFTDAGTNTLLMKFNGDTGTNYQSACVEGNSTTYDGYALYERSNMQTCFSLYGGSSSSSYFAGAVIDINNYQDTDKYKTMISYYGVNQVTSGRLGYSEGTWLNTSAISSITISIGANFTTGTTFSLYGIRG